MNIQEALNIFGLSGQLTEKDIKNAFKKAALKYHPDRNPVGAEMMKAVNSAFDFLMANLDKINQYQSPEQSAIYNYGDELENDRGNPRKIWHKRKIPGRRMATS